MIFLKVEDETGSPGLVALEKIVFISTNGRSDGEEVQCRIHFDGNDNFVDIRNSYEDIVERLTILLGGGAKAYDPITGQ